MTFYMHWETKNSCDLLNYNNRFIAMAWNQICNISAGMPVPTMAKWCAWKEVVVGSGLK